MAVKKEQRRGLGRGLSALMADVEPAADDRGPRAEREIPIERIVPNPDQPRRRFTDDQIEELTASIRAKGVIQPLIVRVDPSDETLFQIVAGERRWRAAQKARLHTLPVIVRDFDDTEVLEVAIIENIQRADLTAIEEAHGYRQLMHKFGHTQEKLAEALGKSRSHIANLMRLLNLPDPVQDMITDGRLSAGHARTLITAENAQSLAQTIVAKGLSVREAEKLARGAGGGGSGKSRKRKESGGFPMERDADTRALEGDLSATLGMKVVIEHKPGGESGRITIQYDTLEQLDSLCGLLSTHG